MDEALVDLIVKDLQPFSIVEDSGFKTFVSMLDPTYILPSRHSLKTMVEQKYEEEKNKTKAAMLNVQAVSLTSDMWTSINMEAYLSVTCHFVDGTKLATVLLGIIIILLIIIVTIVTILIIYNINIQSRAFHDT